MTLIIKFSKTPVKAADTAIVGVYEDKKLSVAGKALDKAAGGLISQSLKTQDQFGGKTGETMSLALPAKSGYVRAVVLGLGKVKALNELKTEEAGGRLFAALKNSGAQKAVIFTDNIIYAAHLANGINLRSYNFIKFKAQKQDGRKPLSLITLVSAQGKDFAALDIVTQAVFTARDLVNEPPNTLYPDHYANLIKKELAPLGVKVDILDEKKMAKLGMGAILAVGMGSARPPRLVIMRWKGSKSGKKGPLALVGKGVTFDTGGISIKPPLGMEEMKMDMGGSAAVVGAIKALATRKSKADVVGIVALAENMPSHTAYRPGDIITSYSGKTIEVLNTDAEGRLVLCDALTYVQEQYKPRAIIDLATLTGAMMVALGHEYCGTFVTHDDMWAAMESASRETGEKLWRMPLDEAWKKDMEGDAADLQNMGRSGRMAGGCTAAGFLQHFIEGDTPWAHMDIAGTAWRKSDQPTVPRNGSGFGVRVLDRLIADHYE